MGTGDAMVGTRSTGRRSAGRAYRQLRGLRGAAAPQATLVVVVGWLLGRGLTITGFALAQLAQGQPAGWAQLAARWDGEWYVMLARDGYPPTLDLPGRPFYGPWGFFPFWPWTIRALSAVLGDHPLAAAAIATAAYGLLVTAAVWVAAYLVGGRRIALASTALFSVFPGTLSLTMPYTEGSFIFWSIVALLALGTARAAPMTAAAHLEVAARPWWLTGLAAVAAFMACGTRSTGLALIVAVAVHALVSWLRGRRLPWGHLVVIVAGALGVVADFTYAAHRTGDPFIWRRAQAQWNQIFDFGHGLLVAFTETVPSHGADYRHWAVMLVMSVVLCAAVILAAVSWRRIPLTWWVFVVVTLALVLLWSSVGPRPRMLLALFPIFIAASMTLLRWRIAGWILIAAIGAVSAIGTVAYAFAVFYLPWHITA
ncbi:hypothetical protein HUN58_10760 [Curtobacterium sp. Csp1]|uniref:hypothetical protein n=1 Tax=Curtobacterium sp. Csp1 TaxID=2495429 RepID=UPI00159B509D|nr:hypothetical protein [Curtobacterium sp. Csp1]QKS20357.1 hypothetical protein HUN58_10760 [Curtobacterium sp. Csp1]